MISTSNKKIIRSVGGFVCCFWFDMLFNGFFLRQRVG